MSTPQPQKMKVFKSRKELVILGVLAVAFAVIVYAMYFNKKKSPAAPGPPPAHASAKPDAETPPAAPAAEPAAEPASDSGPTITLAQAVAGENFSLQPPAPPPLPRNPFLGQTLRDKIYPAARENKTLAPAAELVVAPDELPAALAKLPGAEQAAAKGITLEGVLITSNWRAAVINGQVVPAGQSILGLTVASVLNDRITLEVGTHRIILLIQPPIPMRHETQIETQKQ